jgi:hypothetical protein
MNKYYAFITNQNSNKEFIINIIKNLNNVYVPNCKRPLKAGAAVGLLSNTDLSSINLEKCFDSAIRFSLDQDEDCQKYIFLLSVQMNEIKINKSLNLDKKNNFFENFCNIFVSCDCNSNLIHPNLKLIKLEEMLLIL